MKSFSIFLIQNFFIFKAGEEREKKTERGVEKMSEKKCNVKYEI